MEENKATVRNYLPADRNAILELLELNTPEFFSPAERKDLEYYLDHEIESYFVLEIDGVVAGSGGINFSEDKKTGVISWDMIHPFYHGKGFGVNFAEASSQIIANNTFGRKNQSKNITAHFPVLRKIGIYCIK
jgi:ribosomal-protein-alanine N-acetyltransferase